MMTQTDEDAALLAALNGTAPKPAAVAPPTTNGVRRLQFGKLAVKKEETKTAYPVFDNAQAAEIAARIKTRKDEIDAIEAAIETDKLELKQSVGLFYFQVNHGKAEVPSSISVPSPAGEVLVSFADRYSKVEDDRAIVAVLGAERAGKYFREQNDIKIDCAKIPGDVAQQFVNDLTELLTRYNAADAAAITSSIKPVADFHTARHTVLTVAENVALDEAIPIVAMIKTKGRGGKK